MTEQDVHTIQVRVMAQDGGEVLFQIKKTTPLKRLMEAYCQRMGLQQKDVRFVYDGQRIQQDFTPGDLQMEGGAIVDVVLQQTGGTARQHINK